MNSLRRVLLACALLVSVPAAHADAYPAHQVRLIVGYAAGGGTDLIARLLASSLAQELGQPVIVENKPGAGGNIATDLVARAAPDGYTLLLAANTVTINPHLYRDMASDIARDLRGVGIIATSPILLVGALNAPFTTFDDMLAYAKAHPGAIAYGTPGIGTPQHLAVELLQHMVGVRMTHAPYKGSAQSLSDLLAGHIQLASAAINSAEPYLASGKLRGIAVADAHRVKALPSMPSVSEKVPGYEVRIWYGVMAPAKTPDAVVEKVSRAMAEAAKTPRMAARMAELGYEAASGTPAGMDEQVREDLKKWGDVISKAHIAAQ